MRIVLQLLMMAFGALACSGQAETSHIAEDENVSSQVVERTDAELQFRTINSGFRSAVAIDYVSTDNSLFVVEQGRNRILRIDDRGVRTDSVGSRGLGDYRFDAPSSIDATNGLQIFVADRNNARVQVFERRLSYLSTITPPSDRQGINPVFFRPEAVTVNNFGDIFVYDAESEHLLKYDRNGRFQLSVSLSVFDLELPLRSIASFEDRLFLLEMGRGLFHEITAQGGYRGFAAASSGVRAFYVRGEKIWGATDTDLIVFNLNGRPLHRFTHNITADIQGIAVSRNQVYIITSGALKAIEKPVN
ncbi:MAG: hypothetical protein LAT84_00080 [Balneolia bacterium]|nr:hypothetical protein [Balneolia bacterium]